MSDKIFDPEEPIPMEFWGLDHWRALAYLDSVIQVHGCFEVGFDNRMRQNRRNFKLMGEGKSCPLRTRSSPLACVMEVHETSRLNGAISINHDDWCCVQDMQSEGLFARNSAVEPGRKLRFSARGRVLAYQVWRHISSGATFSTFQVVKGKAA